MASMEMLDTTCETSGCSARAIFIVKRSSGIVLGRHCRRHAPDALKAQQDLERNQPKEVAAR
jgi:hypothetical protein